METAWALVVMDPYGRRQVLHFVVLRISVRVFDQPWLNTFLCKFKIPPTEGEFTLLNQFLRLFFVLCNISQWVFIQFQRLYASFFTRISENGHFLQIGNFLQIDHRKFHGKQTKWSWSTSFLKFLESRSKMQKNLGISVKIE